MPMRPCTRPKRLGATGLYCLCLPLNMQLCRHPLMVGARPPPLDYPNHSPERHMKLLMIDNYDSFTYNIVQYLGELGADVTVARNDEITLEEIEARLTAGALDRLVISPGPCSPAEAGISVAAIQRFAGRLPILGVCLGHQAIGAAFGGKIIRAQQLMHGKTSSITTTQEGVFAGLPAQFTVNRYHSLSIERATCPACLKITAWTDDGEIMGIKHTSLDIEGVQFHPESILTEHGHAMLKNFLKPRGTDRSDAKRTSSVLDKLSDVGGLPRGTDRSDAK